MDKICLRVFSVVSAVTVLAGAGSFPAAGYTESTVICPVFNNEKPDSDAVIVGIQGDYHCDIQAALDRINEIRLEACTEGLVDPDDTSRRLTKKDYVPIKWSSELEKAARQRSAEATTRIGHTRPNDKRCFTCGSEDVFSTSEVLAWNWSDTIVSGVEQFYSEKQLWVEQKGEYYEYGHYMAMIAPSNTYVGMSSFTSDRGPYHNCVAGRFGSDAYNSKVDESYGSEVSGCIASIIVCKKYVSSPSLKLVGGSSNLAVGKAARFELRAKSSIDGADSTLTLVNGIKWTSSDSTVATVDKYGRVVGKSAGTATITGSSAGFKASKTVTVTSNGSDLSGAKVSIEGRKYAYTGKALTPSATVKLGSTTLKKGTDYTISYSNNKNTGKAQVKITGKGKYTGSKTVCFYIKPAKQKITGISRPAKKQLRIKWKKNAAQYDGYQIFYSRSKSFASKKSVTLSGGNKKTLLIKGLPSGKRYYVKVRSFKVIDGKKYYGVCSPVKSAKIK